jgi:fumarate hydratase subunit beta
MREVRLKTPITEGQARVLHVGDRVRLSGVIVTARDRAHRWLVEEAKPEDLPAPLAGGVIFHCGPIGRRKAPGWELVAAGPTTSERMNAYAPEVLRKFGVRGIVGKGGMNRQVLDALRESGAVYLSAVGGAAQVLASKVERVAAVAKLEEFGAPEALWVFEVKDFPVMVTMDTHARSLHAVTAAESHERMKDLLKAK